MVGLSGLSLLNEVRDERLDRMRGPFKIISKRFSEESLELIGWNLLDYQKKTVDS
jgi:hypothetical protein